jgi:para-aminobenzoate synthetase / 4-amino-4-deoxychorismate lyase
MIEHFIPSEVYDVVAERSGSVLLETTRIDESNFRSYLFLDPTEVLTLEHAQDADIFMEEIERRTQNGFYAAGYFSYEFGQISEPQNYGSQVVSEPLAWFGVYREALIFDHTKGKFTDWNPNVASYLKMREPTTAATISEVSFEYQESEYCDRLSRILEYIRSGDTYQINFTGRLNFQVAGRYSELFRQLRSKQRVSYAAYINSGERHVLSFSPELFVRLEGDKATTKPMKGTIRRGRTNLEDTVIGENLIADKKTVAENIMIVDLLRNDLGRICVPGSIEVTRLFEVERYASLLQVTSTITGTLHASCSYGDLIKNLFPCGSIIGAPKVRSMEIIAEQERSHRGIYTGSIGFFGPNRPDIDSRHAVFNVAIRTLVLDRLGNGIMGIGGGIVYDSDPVEELAECFLKANFLTKQTPRFKLFETILFSQQLHNTEAHLKRLAESARYFDFPIDIKQVRWQLTTHVTKLIDDGCYRIKLMLDDSGKVDITSTIFSQDSAAKTVVALCKSRVSSADPFLFHKTTHRALYDLANEYAVQHGYADLLFFNEYGVLTEGGKHNVYVEFDGKLFTSPLHVGLLPGTIREQLLASEKAMERELLFDDLIAADAIYLSNALWGLRRVTLDPIWVDIPVATTIN